MAKKVKVLADYSDIKVLFRVPFVSLKQVAGFPTKTREIFRRIVNFLVFQYFFWFVAACFVKAMWTIPSFNILVFADSMGPALTIFAVLVKYQIFIRNGHEYFELLSELERQFKFDFNKKATKLNEEKAKKLYRLNAIFYSLPCLTGVGYFLLPIVVLLVKTFQGIEYTPKLPLSSSWPWDTTNSAGLWVAYCYLALACYFVPPGMTGVDNTITDLLAYTSSLFDAVCYDLEDLGKNLQSSEKNYKKLEEIAKKHIAAIEFSHKVTNLLVPMTLIQFIAAAIQICLGGYCIISAESAMMVFTYIGYSSSILTETFFFCWGGDLLYEAV